MTNPTNKFPKYLGEVNRELDQTVDYWLELEFKNEVHVVYDYNRNVIEVYAPKNSKLKPWDENNQNHRSVETLELSGNDDKAIIHPTLDQIIQQIEVSSMIALQRSMQDGDPKHHKEMIAKAKESINSWHNTQTLKIIKDKIFPEYSGVSNPGYTFMINKRDLDKIIANLTKYKEMKDE